MAGDLGTEKARFCVTKLALRTTRRGVLCLEADIFILQFRSPRFNQRFLKGLNSGRRSQILEWICAHLAEASNLPVAPYAIVHIPEVLWNETDATTSEIGHGLAFGSEDETGTLWLEPHLQSKVPDSQQQALLVFDWWIHNIDRMTSNPNLLWHPSDSRLVVIDHNQAFDPEFCNSDFTKHHIFKSQMDAVFLDLVEQARHQQQLLAAVPVLEQAIESIPEEWWWVDEEKTVPTNVNLEQIQQTLRRCSESDFWSIS